MGDSKLKAVRNALKINQKEFAAMLGIQQSYYSALELGKKDISSKLLETLVLKIGVNPDWYFSSKGAIFNSSNAGKDWGIDGGNSSKSSDLSIDKAATIKAGDNQIPGSPSTEEERSKSIEQQSVIAEKAVQELILNNKEYAIFRDSFFEIASFINIIDNVTYSGSINKLFKIEEVRKHYISRSATELKSFISADFGKFEPYISTFKDLANAMRTFREKAKEIPEKITGIDIQEFDY